MKIIIEIHNTSYQVPEYKILNQDGLAVLEQKNGRVHTLHPQSHRPQAMITMGLWQSSDRLRRLPDGSFCNTEIYHVPSVYSSLLEGGCECGGNHDRRGRWSW